MLPSPSEMRQRSRFYLKAARHAIDPDIRDRHIDCAFVLAQIAQMIERDEQRANANAVRLAQTIADALAAANAAPSDGATRECVISDC